MKAQLQIVELDERKKEKLSKTCFWGNKNRELEIEDKKKELLLICSTCGFPVNKSLHLENLGRFFLDFSGRCEFCGSKI